ncbi:MAG TPA: sigma-70 family RNA polymerase sigma factor [Vicinamibacterales bacterium]|nr:sigma-70 family RNA polymerase sigma factor [Vicinamibacterales bacterium]
MHESVTRHPGTLVTMDADLEREFEARLQESADLAVRVAYGVLRQQQDAEEIAQEAYVKAYRSFSSLRDRGAFRSWLVRMTWRLAIDRWRADRSRVAREQTWAAAPEMTPESVASANQRAARLWTAIDELPEKLRQTIVLSAIQGYDVREVSALLGLAEGTVKSRLFLARRRLAQRLKCLVNDTGRQ